MSFGDFLKELVTDTVKDLNHKADIVNIEKQARDAVEEGNISEVIRDRCKFEDNHLIINEVNAHWIKVGIRAYYIKYGSSARFYNELCESSSFARNYHKIGRKELDELIERFDIRDSDYREFKA